MNTSLLLHVIGTLSPLHSCGAKHLAQLVEAAVWLLLTIPACVSSCNTSSAVQPSLTTLVCNNLLINLVLQPERGLRGGIWKTGGGGGGHSDVSAACLLLLGIPTCILACVQCLNQPYQTQACITAVYSSSL